jgi:hypothetical protein
MEASALSMGSRRNEDIALDLMKFVAMTTGYGRTAGSGVGFRGGAAADLKCRPSTRTVWKMPQGGRWKVIVLPASWIFGMNQC